MKNLMLMLVLVLVLVLVLLASACGNKGDLYLPDKSSPASQAAQDGSVRR